MFARVLLSFIVLAACGCSSPQSEPPGSPSPTPIPGAAPVRILMLTATTGFRHDSIPTARQVMADVGSRSNFSVTATEDLSLISESSLRGYDVLFFALTTGELPLSADQKAAILGFVRAGGGFLGAHSATDTLYEWAEYGSLVGAYFKEHPWTQTASVIVEDPSHPSTAGLGDRFSILEEFYTFRENPRPRVRVLLRLDAASVGASGDFPLAWTNTFGEGRVYYNALGHFSETWRDTRFQQQIVGAIRWAARR